MPSARKVNPTGSAASWGIVNGVMAMSPISKLWPDAKVWSFEISGITPSSSRDAFAQAWCVAPVMNTGAPSFLESVRSPETWSECSWVISTADNDWASSPIAFIRLKISRQEMPASTRMRVLELATMALLPRLPLAKIETQTPMILQHSRNCLWKGSDYMVKQHLGARRGRQNRHSELCRQQSGAKC